LPAIHAPLLVLMAYLHIRNLRRPYRERSWASLAAASAAHLTRLAG
jgi:hypothetical protein